MFQMTHKKILRKWGRKSTDARFKYIRLEHRYRWSCWSSWSTISAVIATFLPRPSWWKESFQSFMRISLTNIWICTAHCKLGIDQKPIGLFRKGGIHIIKSNSSSLKNTKFSDNTNRQSCSSSNLDYVGWMKLSLHSSKINLLAFTEIFALLECGHSRQISVCFPVPHN